MTIETGFPFHLSLENITDNVCNISGFPFQVYGRRLCSYFHWYDGEGNVRDRKVISGLIRKLEVHKKKEIYLTRCCVIGWGLSAVFLLVIVMLLLKIYLRK